MVSNDLVEGILGQTFEEMAFLDVAPGATGQPAPSGDDGPVLFLSYSKPQTGAFVLFLPKAVKYQVAESIYGADTHQLSNAQLDDSLLELMNVLAGRLLTARFGESSYTMGLPTVLYDPPTDLPGQSRKFLFHSDQNDLTLVWSEVG